MNKNTIAKNFFGGVLFKVLLFVAVTSVIVLEGIL